jgi:sorbitol-specific phosphotransferase system component IIBC
VAAAAAVYSTFSARAKSTTGWGTTTDVDTANADLLVKITGMMIVTVAGNIELWHGSEVAAASTVKAGSSLILTKTD